MRTLWWIPLSILGLGAALFVRFGRRPQSSVTLTTDAVSGEWLAQARGREEQEW
jgi:hypothetical protein